MLKRVITNRMFWVGAQITILVSIIAGFLDGRHDWKYTMIWGSIAILLIGLDVMLLHNKKDE
jgi:MFS-type transporter involved in bile tolerance (Atg22 family)